MLSSLRSSGRRMTSILPRSYFKNVEAVKFGRMIQRISANEKKRKQRPPLLLEKRSLLSAYDNEGSSRRVTALNKLYMEQITTMVHSGDCGRRLADLGIEISRVKMASGFNYLNVYWVTRKDNIPKEVLNSVLSRALGELQQGMGSVGFTSKVPFLKFVRDIRLENEIHLEKIFQTADFGTHFKPVHEKKVVTEEFVSGTRILPKMRQDTLGLDHAKIKARIEAAIIRFKAINTDNSVEPVGEIPSQLIQFNKKDFYKFYKRNRILLLKMRKLKDREGFQGYEFEEYEDDDGLETEDEEEYEYEDNDGLEIENEREYKYEEDEYEEDEYENEYKSQK